MYVCLSLVGTVYSTQGHLGPKPRLCSNNPMNPGDFILESYDGRKLWATLHLPPVPKGPPIVMAHGLLGFKDWAFFPFVAESLAAAGFPVVRFNFSGSGMAGHADGPFTDLTGFENDTITRQVEDLHSVISAIRAGLVPGLEASDRVFLWGHSRGGGVAILTAVRDPAVSALALWAPISRVNRYSVERVRAWRRRGYDVLERSRTGQALKSSVVFLDDVEKWAREGDVPVQLFRLKAPRLLVHGNEDKSVPPEESESLAAVAPGTRLAILAGADHKFNSSHPFDGPSPQLAEALAVTTAFYLEFAL